MPTSGQRKGQTAYGRLSLLRISPRFLIQLAPERDMKVNVEHIGEPNNVLQHISQASRSPVLAATLAGCFATYSYSR